MRINLGTLLLKIAPEWPLLESISPSVLSSLKQMAGTTMDAEQIALQLTEILYSI